MVDRLTTPISCSRLVLLLALLPALACGGDDVATMEAGTTGSSSTGSTTLSADASSSSSSSSGTIDDGSSSTGGGEAETGADASGSSGGEVPAEPLPWSEDCAIGPTDLGGINPALECAAVQVPLDWDDPKGELITIAAMRVRSDVSPHRGQLWMLDGGPGGSGLGFAWPQSVAPLVDAGWDVLIPAHRGTISPQLNCGVPASMECRAHLEMTWGDGLRHFNTLQAAHDLGHLIERTAAETDEPSVVYGISYGTLWGQYYLGLYPDQAAGVVLDSVLGAFADVTEQEALTDSVVRGLLQRCFDDPSCAARLPAYDSGDALADAVVAAFDENDCGPGDVGSWEDSNIRSALGVLANAARSRNFVPLIAGMLAQCDPILTETVQDAVQPLLSQVAAAPVAAEALPLTTWGIPAADDGPWGIPGSFYFSPVLFGLVVGTTIIPDGRAPQLPSSDGIATLGFGLTLTAENDVWGSLPNVTFDPLPARTPVLVLNADYDLQTPAPWAEDVADALGEDLVRVEDGAHGLFGGIGGVTLEGMPCIRSLVLDFAADPEASGTASCLSDLPSIDPNLERSDLQTLAIAAFDTPDPWSLLPGGTLP